jgi:hypothetical protein
VQEVEVEIQARKGEVERLIQDMKSANLESLTIISLILVTLSL